ncbi:thiocillin family RiPP [Staphylococcus epidermidis]|uniref:thiocillin family RiPP n=1 Tax=Staphylococcus epidermidis TaxID=1282 RepID=UPI00136D7E97|nr:thiocillin family RiPP [Staphylococcus epidermidis]MCD8887126.1 thiocillin family RiPP [Staphylococcus epidermidis]MCG1130052.1 thiocillin family RiPP [Staphylococcus epidermidis]MCG1263364.1 thiocillin family RiPP [Staphylococcus epidermidis]MCG1303489.1 thiocillin family RiPP [Staphylococcus epidermidis]MCG1361473.1 thiocillin family RiPP [Staphylococcus epidermidis]
MDNYNFNLEDIESQMKHLIDIEEEEIDFHGFTTAGSFACAASWGSCASSGSSFSSAGN